MTRTMTEYKKCRYQSAKDNWGDFESEYYILLNAVDRIRDTLIARYGYFAEAERRLGYGRTELTKRYSWGCIIPNIRGLDRLLRALNLSYQYIIFGGEETPYSINRMTLKNFEKVYNEGYEGRKNPRISAMLTKTKAGKCRSVALKYLIRVAREQRRTIDWLLGG